MAGATEGAARPHRPGDVAAAAKSALRARVRRARAAVPPEARAAAETSIAASLADLLDGRALVLGYAAVGSEVSVEALLRRRLAGGGAVAMPRVVAPGALALHLVTDLGADLAPGAHDIPEPLPHLPRVDPAAVDAVLVPGLAFTRDGARLGQGGGYYDRLLPRLRPALAVGVCLEVQVLADVVTEPHDAAVDAVVTEAGVYRSPLPETPTRPPPHMPTYEYECLTNGHRFEVKQSFSDDALTACTECGEPVRKVFSAAGLVFKGSGYYVTDTRAPAKSGGSGSSSSSSDGKGSSGGGSDSSSGSSTSATSTTSSSSGSSGSSGKSSGSSD